MLGFFFTLSILNADLRITCKHRTDLVAKQCVMLYTILTFPKIRDLRVGLVWAVAEQNRLDLKDGGMFITRIVGEKGKNWRGLG